MDNGKTAQKGDAILAADLDGTLHAGDLAATSAKMLALRRPWMIPSILLWLKKSRLELKLQLAKRVSPRMETLHWNKEVIDFLRASGDKGARLVLATAAVEPHAELAADYLASAHKLSFERIIRSTETVNMHGGNKAEALRKYAEESNASFDYIGDSPRQDPPVFAAARVSHFVDPTPEMLERYRSADSRVFYSRKGPLRRFAAWALSKIQEKGPAENRRGGTGD